MTLRAGTDGMELHQTERGGGGTGSHGRMRTMGMNATEAGRAITLAPSLGTEMKVVDIGKVVQGLQKATDTEVGPPLIHATRVTVNLVLLG